MIGIRADANNIIATGHVMRCLTIASELRKLGEEVVFFTADHEADALLDGTDVRHVCLDSDWEDLESELEVFIEQLQVRGISTLLVDSYRATYDYLKALSRVCHTAYIDDLHEGVYPVDILINYNGYQDIFDYKSDYKDMRGFGSESTKLLLGCRYSPLREQFANAWPTHGNGRQVLLAAGGGDICGLMAGVLEKAELSDDELIRNISWHVVVGRYIEDEKSLMDLADRMDNVTIHKSVSDMAGLMGNCDYAVSASGTMLTECAVMGLPTVYVMTADNQRYDVDYWNRYEAFVFGGDISGELDKEKKSAIFTDILCKLRGFMQSSEEIDMLREELHQITDGKGARYIAEELIEL